jgi:hypothetical protein
LFPAPFKNGALQNLKGPGGNQRQTAQRRQLGVKWRPSVGSKAGLTAIVVSRLIAQVQVHTDLYKERFAMSDTLGAPEKSQTDEHREKYFSFQIKGWTNFDPMDKTLASIAKSIEQGDGFLTLLEVLNVENDLAAIGDEEVRECFANILAAKRLVKTVHELPKNLIQELRTALTTEERGAPRKTVPSVANMPMASLPVASLSGNDESGPRAKQWP